MIKEIAVADIRIDGGTQHRELDSDQILVYSALIGEYPKRFPAIEVMFDGKDHWLTDGFHRLFAYKKLKKETIQADVDEGTKRDAQLKSFHANSSHGLPRPKGTVKKLLMERIFPDEEWGKQSDADIADFVGGITRRYVSMCRAEYEKPATGQSNSDKGSTSHTGKEKSTKASEPEKEVSVTEVDKDTNSTVLDSKGKPVPEHLQEAFQRTEEIREYIRIVNDMYRTIEAAQKGGDLLWSNCNLGHLKEAVGNVRNSLRFAMPYAVCPYCGGDVNNQECRACNSKGFVNEQAYRACPVELK